MSIPARFIKNLKATVDKKQFTEDETKLILACAQECATLSAMEQISLLENIQLAIEESLAVMDDAEFDGLKKELFEDGA